MTGRSGEINCSKSHLTGGGVPIAVKSTLDRVDTEILNLIQGGFPISPDPYKEIGAVVGISGQEALSRAISLIERGVIRKIGPFFDAKKMGCSSTLCAVEVPEERLEEIYPVINGFPEVTHNYLREGSPNLWFTIIAESKDRIAEIISTISKRCAIGPVRDLPATKTFKIKVDLKIES